MKAFILFSLYSTFVYGGEYNDERYDTDKRENHLSAIDFENAHYKVMVGSNSENYEIDYENYEIDYENYEIDYEINHSIESKLRYCASNSSGYETPIQSNVMIIGIQEWCDCNYDGPLHANETVAKLYFIGENQYEPITCKDQDIDDPVVQTTSVPSFGNTVLLWNYTIVYNDMNTMDMNTMDMSFIILNASRLNTLIETYDEYEGTQTTGIWFCFSSTGANKIYWDPDIGVYATSSNASFRTSISSKKYLSGIVRGIVAMSFAGYIAMIIF